MAKVKIHPTLEQLKDTLFFTGDATFTIFDNALNLIEDHRYYGELSKHYTQAEVLTLDVYTYDFCKNILDCGVYLK